MKFISRRVARAKQKHQAGGKRPAASQHRMDKGAIQQHGQNCILRNMRQLAHKKLHAQNREGRNCRIKPMQQRPDNTRSMLGRHQIGRPDENEGQPDYDRQPVSKKCSQIRKVNRAVVFDNLPYYRFNLTMFDGRCSRFDLGKNARL